MDGDAPVACEFGGWLENAVGRVTRERTPLCFTGAVAPVPTGGTRLAWSAEEAPGARPPVLIDDFESGTFDRWTVEGAAFGTTPQKANTFRHEHGYVRCVGGYYADSFAHGGDDVTGRLTSKPFVSGHVGG